MPIPSGLPHPRRRLPFFGDVKLSDMRTPTQRLVGFSRALGPIFEQKVFAEAVAIVAGTELVNEVNDDKHWEKHVGHTLRKLRPLLGNGLFTAQNNDPEWGKARRILDPGFQIGAMRVYHDSIKASVEELCGFWRERPTSDGWAEVSADANRLTFEIITRAGFSRSFDAIRGQKEESFIEAFIRELTFANRKTDTLPDFEKIFLKRRIRLHERDVAHARQVVDDIIATRRANDDTRESDILDLMLNTPDEATGEQLSDDNMRYQILTFLIAGSETSANAISFALHYLSINPDVARKARDEVDQRWPGREFPDIQYKDVGALRYIRSVAEETLRMWPPVPGYFRQAKHDGVILGGEHRFDHKDWVFVLLQAAQRDPRYWGDDADEFVPERFTRTKIADRVYRPFGIGARDCIGKAFAMHEIILALAGILHQFDLEPDPHYRLTVSEGSTLKPVKLRLRLHGRK